MAFDLTAGAGPPLVPLPGWRGEEGCAASELPTRLRRSALRVGEKKDPLQIGKKDPRLPHAATPLERGGEEGRHRGISRADEHDRIPEKLQAKES